MAKRHGFTLIELLVVVTIIVVLLALLIPALDKAIYQAEVMLCGTRQKAIAAGAITYAYDFKRRYPNRPGNREAENTTSFAPFHLKNRTDNNPLNARDLRPIIKDHIGTKLLSCPLAGEQDLSIESTQNSDKVIGGFNLFFGFTYTRVSNFGGTSAPEKGMLKTGDRWTFENSDVNTGAPTVRRFDLLVVDIDWQKGNGESFGSHPDDAGTLSQVVATDQLSPFPTDGTVTLSWWQKGPTTDPLTRGLIDINAAREDGSAVRYSGVKASKGDSTDFTDIALFDTRFGYPGEWMNVPLR